MYYLRCMNNAKLIGLLRTFTSKDLRRFRDYLNSPFFNKRQDLIDFFAVIQTLAPDFPEEDLSKKKVWQAYAPDRPFDEKELAYLMNFLLKQAENYIAIQKTEDDPTTKGTHLLAHYLRHGLNKHYRAVYQKTSRSLEQEPFRDAEWHLKAWRLAEAEVNHFYSFRSRKPDASIIRAAEHLDAFYLDKKLEMSSEAINLNQILEAGFDTSFIEELLAFLEKRKSSEPTVKIRTLVVNILRNPEDFDSFRELRRMLPEAHSYFQPEPVKGIFAYAQNFCIRRIKSGDLDYQQELFSIYQESIELGVIFQDGFLSPWNFKNVCSIALKLGEYEWTRNFIEKNKKHLPLEFRSSAIAYNLANLHFHQGQYDQALKALTQVEFTDIFYALDTRRMTLMIYFERGDYEALNALISSFRIFLRRNRIVSEKNRAAYKNFVDWLARIFRYLQKRDSLSLSEAEAEIAQTKPIVEGAWLIQKCKTRIS